MSDLTPEERLRRDAEEKPRQRRRSLTKRQKWTIGLGIFGVWLAIGLSGGFDQPKTAPTAAAVAKPAPPAGATPAPESAPMPGLHLGAEALYAAYEVNEVRANQKYTDKEVAIAGAVAYIRDSVNGPCVALRAGGIGENIECTFPDKDRPTIAGMNPGEALTVAGKCRRWLGSVSLEDCWLP